MKQPRIPANPHPARSMTWRGVLHFRGCHDHVRVVFVNCPTCDALPACWQESAYCRVKAGRRTISPPLRAD